jgi:D-erythronate 2-dehydrogenase
MEILVTGGAGFLGQQIIAQVLEHGIKLDGVPQTVARITCFDMVAGAIFGPRIRNVVGDISSPALMKTLVTKDTRVVVHLAAVVSGTAEADFALGMRVNLDGTRALLDACHAAGAAPRLLFSSSVATFGGDMPAVIQDGTTPTPQGSYGIQKLLGELLVQDYSRKGYIDGRTLRVPTVVVRPGKPNGAASGFASGIIREPLAGIAATLPVAMDTKMWVASPTAVIANFMHALDLPASAWGLQRSVNLPGLTVAMDQALAALEKLGGAKARALVTQTLDDKIIRLVNSWPALFNTARANAMGFKADQDFDAIVRNYLTSSNSTSN